MKYDDSISWDLQALHRELIKKEEQIERLMKQDNLTGLLNWPSTMAFLESSLRNYNPLGLLYVNFDHFKAFNRTYGFVLGDLLLSRFGSMVREHGVVEDGAVGRFNGEGFLAVVPYATKERLEDISGEIAALMEVLTVEMPDMPLVKAGVTAGIGGVLWDGPGEMSPYVLLIQADIAIRLDSGVKVLPVFCNFSRLHFPNEGFAEQLYVYFVWKPSSGWAGCGSISRVRYYQCTVTVSDKRPLIQSMYVRLGKMEGAGDV